MKRLLLTTLMITTGWQIKGQDALSLQDAIGYSLANNFSIKIAHNDQKITDNNHQPGNAGMLPVLDLDANKNYTRQNIALEIQGSDGIFDISKDWAKSDRLDAGARLNWTVFDGFGMFMTMEKLKSMKNWGDINTQQVVQNTIAQVNNAYHQVLLEKERLRVLEENMEISRQRQEFAENRYLVGKGSKVDYLSAQVDYNSDRTGLIVQQQRIDHAKVDLNIVMGRNVDTPMEVLTEVSIDSTLQYFELEKKS